jgi:hypothetical protein
MSVCLISGFLREMDDNCTSLGYYAASSDKFLPTFRNKLAVQTPVFEKRKFLGFMKNEGGKDMMSRNVHKKLQLLAD